MPLTSEQNEQWKRAINPLDHVDFHALSDDGIEAFRKRFDTGKRAPSWALTVRSHCIYEGRREAEAWVPEFAWRSEVAMAGVTILYPHPEDRVDFYRSLLVDFLHRVLAPLVEDYPTLRGLHELLGNREQQEPLLSEQLRAIEEKRLEIASLKEWNDYTSAYGSALSMAEAIIKMLTLIYFDPSQKWRTRGGLALANSLTVVHTFRIECLESLSEDFPYQSPYQPVADAFLAALEAECPPPDWLTVL